MHFVFAPPGESAAGLLDLPWTAPLDAWDDERLVEIRRRGLSRHTVRFVAEGGAVYALKELDALVELLVRLHLAGFMWGDCSLSNVLFRMDAGPSGVRLRVRTRVAEPGHHRRILMARTGLDAQENQARRLLNDIAAYRGHLERVRGGPVPEVVAANQWLAEVYEPVINAIPDGLRDRLDDVELFHEVLEHRWFLSEKSGRDVGTMTAAHDYFASVLPGVPEDLTETGRPPDRTS